MRVLVTGVTGFLGRSLALWNNGHHEFELFGLARQAEPSSTVYRGDITDIDFLKNTFKAVRPDAVLHLAASRSRSTQFSDVFASLQQNVIGSGRLLDAIIDSSTVRRVVCMGTVEEYGNGPVPYQEDQREHPATVYSASKIASAHLCELFSESSGVPVVYMRPSVCYGPGQPSDMFLSQLIRALVQNSRFPMTAGEQTRDFLYVTDLVEAMARAVQSDSKGFAIVNVAAGVSVRIRDVATLVARQLGKEELLDIGAIPYRRTEVMSYSVDISRAERMLNWRPQVGLDAGVRLTIEAMTKQR